MTNDKETLLQHTPIFDLVEKADPGSIGFKPVGINSPDWITIAVEKDGKWLLEKQMRYGKMKEYVEFPSGMVEAGEDPKLAAQRELLEETGYDVSIDDIVPLGNFEANPAFMSNSMFYFYVNLDTARWQLKKQNLDQHEKIELLWSDKQSAFDSYFSTHDSVFKAGLFLLLQKAGIKLS